MRDGPWRNSSVKNTKVFAFTGIIPPGDIHVLDNRSLWATFTPFDQSYDILFRPFADDFYSTVPQVFNATGEAQFISPLFCVVPVEYTLNKASDEYLRPSQH
jgi:hypothetical protein